MMNNDMMKMMMMSQMMGGGDSENGAAGGMDMAAMMQLFGQPDSLPVESVWEDAVTFGTARDRHGTDTIGVLETRVIPGHADDPTPRVRIKTNDVILARPEDLRKIASRFAAMADDPMLIDAWEDVTSEESLGASKKLYDEKRSMAAFSAMS